MIEIKRTALEQEQEILMHRYRQYEAMQRDFSFDLDFYSYAEEQMQKLDDAADYIRSLLEGQGDGQ